MYIKSPSTKVHVNGRLDAGKFIEKSGNIKVDLYNCGSSSDSVAGNIKMDYLFVHPIKLQKDEPIDTLWPRLGNGVFSLNRNFTVFELQLTLD